MHLLQLPFEIRLNIYSQLFGRHVAYINAGRQDAGSAINMPTMFPNQLETFYPHGRSAQILRTCKAIFEEALPLLYENTTFRTSFQAFAGRLPSQVADQAITFPFVRRLEWELRCDLLKRHCPEEVVISESDVCNLRFVQLTCQVETWRDSFCGEWVDRESFLRGRQQMIDFAKLLQAKMAGNERTITLVEDTKHLSRGGIVLRLFDGKGEPEADVSKQETCCMKCSDQDARIY